MVLLLEQQHDLTEFLVKKIQSAQIHKNPYFKPLDQGIGLAWRENRTLRTNIQLSVPFYGFCHILHL
jgi:hypothetical protein